MRIWTTFCPKKVSWEITTIQTQGKAASSKWRKQLPIIKNSLKLLKEAGISGIRLVIYPDELTSDGKTFHWEPTEIMLDICKQQKLQVELCVGPFQYPNYPGIYLPNYLLPFVFNNTRCLDTTPIVFSYGTKFLELQLEHFGHDKRIRGFHLANEWPDKQRVFGKEKVRTGISLAFMLQATALLKTYTTKPISLNTNIDVSEKHKLSTVFGELLKSLEDQARLGFDIYPSQETWRKAFLQKLKRMLTSYHQSYRWSRKRFPLCELFFCEVEAQPWGGGQSWYRIVTNELNPQEKVLSYTRDVLQKTFKAYITPCKPYEVSLWGADFWLAAHEMGIQWPLEQVNKIQKT